MQLPPAAAPKVTWPCALGTAVPWGQQCPSPGSLPAPGEQREAKVLSAPKARKGPAVPHKPSADTLRSLSSHSKPLLRDFLVEQSNSSVLNHRKSGVNQVFPSPGTTLLQALPGETERAWQRIHGRLAELIPMVCSCRAAQQPSQHWHCLRSVAKRPKIK